MQQLNLDFDAVAESPAALCPPSWAPAIYSASVRVDGLEVTVFEFADPDFAPDAFKDERRLVPYTARRLSDLFGVSSFEGAVSTGPDENAIQVLSKILSDYSYLHSTKETIH